MGKQNSLIDSEFLEEGAPIEADDDLLDDPFHDPHEKERDSIRDMEVAPEKSDLVIDVVDDTPEEDQGKWVADDDRDGKPELPEDEEVEEYSGKVQNRISKLTARVHAERRAAEDRQRQLDQAVNVAQNLLAQNNELKSVVEQGEKILLGEHKGRLEGALAAARAAYREAHEADDSDGMIAAQEQIAKAVAAMDRVSAHRPRALPREELPAYQKPQQPEVPQPSESAEAWRKRNKWFDEDIPMQAYALQYHKQLVDNGVQVESKEYYDRIDREMRKRFPDRFENERRPRRTESNVAPATRSGPGKKTRRVTLTESQVKIAKRLGLTKEQMAEQILLEQGHGREFTHT